jgi:hypothetical protein
VDYFSLVLFFLAFAALLLAHRYFAPLDNLLGIAFLALIVVVGVISLFKASAGKTITPSFVGALPKTWRRWLLGESDKPK